MAKILETDEMFFKDFEPKQEHRFKMYINGIPSYIIESSDYPKMDFDTVSLPHINTTRKLAGKGTWQPITITLLDPISPSGAQAAIEWQRLCYESITGRAGYSSMYKKELRLEVLGPVGDVVSEWRIVGAFIKSVDYGKGDWNSTNTVNKIPITIEFDYAVLEY